MSRYAVVIEKAGRNFSAYVPDLPGCVATARTAALASRRIKEAVEFHLEGLAADGVKPPKPAAVATWVATKRPARRRRAA